MKATILSTLLALAAAAPPPHHSSPDRGPLDRPQPGPRPDHDNHHHHNYHPHGPPHPSPNPDNNDDDSSPFNPLHHLGANSPWFPGPNIHSISHLPPPGCTITQAVHISRHGSRYPDPSAYNGWLSLHSKLQNATFSATGELKFLESWEPVLDRPELQLAQLSPGGYGELYDFGVDLRTRYPGWYKYGDTMRVFANDFPRTVDSARLFARGFLGPNATTLGTVYAINAKDPSVAANSLATSDSCPTYDDQSGAGYVEVWDDIYLPPIAARLNGLIDGDLVLTESDVSNFPYLCGFESQILREVSPFCGVFSQEEVLQYEYRQDLRYWYGTGIGAGRNASVMLPVVQGVVDLLRAGPEAEVEGGETVGRLNVAFTHDNQINQMVAGSGVFDDVEDLDPEVMDGGRGYVSSRVNPMRGTVAFEKMECEGGEAEYLRLKLNDAVYPVVGCRDGPGGSCGLEEYEREVLARKWTEAGGFESFCELEEGSVTTGEDGGVTFFRDLTLAAMRTVQP